MKQKNTITKLLTTALMALTTATSFAQTNLGAACGCPSPVSARPTVNLSTLATNGGANDGELIETNVILDCSKTWILDKKIYVAPGRTLTIQPGTVIKGNPGTAANATALTVEVGGKIFASGTPDCQIVFTSTADPLDGTYSIANNGQWGGICIAGKASNNLTLAANGPFQAGVGDGRLCVADGIGTFEGFASSNSKDQFGVTPAQFDDNDNSGILRYVSIRHAGAILQVGGELNALSLGSVGRGTTIDHIEIVACADDGIELWGGTVNLKYISFLFGNDDNLDWDDGWRGKAQFVFSITTADATASVDADHGIEADADDQKSNLTPRSHPVIYNATFIGRNKTVSTADNSGMSGFRAKELTEGEIYNSIFSNYRFGFNVTKALGTRTGSSEAYHNWSTAAGNGSNSLKLNCNTFVNTGRAMAIDNGTTVLMTAADSLQFFTTDNNISIASASGFTYAWAMNSTTNAVTTRFDAIPNPALSTSGCPTPPVDGFFSPAPYRGAFDSNGVSWLSQWGYSTVLNVTSGLQPCPTDINKDGVTNVTDFNAVLGAFGTNCQ